MKIYVKKIILENNLGVGQRLKAEGEWDKDFLGNLKNFRDEQIKFKQDRYDDNNETNIKNAENIRNNGNNSKEEKDLDNKTNKGLGSTQEFKSLNSKTPENHMTKTTTK